MTLKFDGWPRKTIAHLFHTMPSFVHHLKSIGQFKQELQSGNAQFRLKNWQFFVPCDLKIWQMSLEKNRAPFLHYVKLCASFQSHWWIQNSVKIGDFLSRVTLKFDEWPWKTIGHLFYATWSFVHCFKATGEFKLELESGNPWFRSKSVIFCPVWPWNLMDDLEKL